MDTIENRREFYELLKDEVRAIGMNAFIPDDDLLDLVMSRCTLVSYPKNHRIIDETTVNRNLYFLKSGLMRTSYFDNDREFTIGIAMAPTLSLSPLGVAMNRTAHYMFTTCSNVELLVLEKKDFDWLMETQPGFSRWMLGVALMQMASLEFKSQQLSGSSKDKYLKLRKREYIKSRYSSFASKLPDIVNEISDRVIASYLGVHPIYLSSIKKEIIDDERKKKD